MGITRLAIVGGSVEDPFDTPLLVPALRDAGVDVHTVSWRDDAVDWTSYDVALLRSCWDYVEAPAEFRSWLDRVSVATTVVNDAALVRWNMDKTYLLDLATRGVLTIPTQVASPDGFEPPADVFVVKPSVGAGSRNIGRYTAATLTSARDHARALHGRGLTPLVQPYVEPATDAGERGVFVIDGQVTHAVLKSQVLVTEAAPADDFRLAEGQSVIPLAPTDDDAAFARTVVAALPTTAPLLYARIDFIVTADGPLLLEAEVIEPALFMDRNPHALPVFTSAVLRLLEGAAPSPG